MAQAQPVPPRVKINPILERDIDRVIFQELYCSVPFATMFLESLGLGVTGDIKAIELSMNDSMEDGSTRQTDLLVTVGGDVLLLIENKITHDLSDEQARAYATRRATVVASGHAKACHTVLLAPAEQLVRFASQASHFDARISYESVLAMLATLPTDARVALARSLLAAAIDKVPRKLLSEDEGVRAVAEAVRNVMRKPEYAAWRFTNRDDSITSHNTWAKLARKSPLPSGRTPGVRIDWGRGEIVLTFKDRDKHQSHYDSLNEAVRSSGRPGVTCEAIGGTQYGIRLRVGPIDPSSPDLGEEVESLIRIALEMADWYAALAI